MSSSDTYSNEKINKEHATDEVLGNISNKRKGNQLDPIDKAKYMYNKANNSRENSRDKIEQKKNVDKIERKKSISSISSSESKKITLRKLW